MAGEDGEFLVWDRDLEPLLDRIQERRLGVADTGVFILTDARELRLGVVL